MKTGSVWKFNVQWNYKSSLFFCILLLLPNLLGFINIPTPLGIPIHTFQIALFLAAILYGPLGGLCSGIVGSVASAIIMHNPYIIVGNAILGFTVGYLLRKKIPVIYAAILGFAIQLPWLFVTDYYLVGLPLNIVGLILVALLVSDTLWAIVSIMSQNHLFVCYNDKFTALKT